ncbi:MAG TPA: hypothetical protein VGO09_02640, partial [Flavisolibacter sp.]|nr:hypothetical protein [Flavisolibacter sp.]
NADLWAYTDSALNYIKSQSPTRIQTSTVLFTLGNKTLTATDWLGYAQTYRYKADGSGTKPYPQIWNEFVEATALDYYQKNMEEFNDEFRQQLNEFKEGNLFFEIMQRRVWGPVQTDSAALYAYYEKNRTKYNWKESADAIIFYSSDLATAKIFTEQLKKNPLEWHSLVSNFSEKIAADSSRFELTQIPNGAKKTLKAGEVTTPVLNKSDNTVSFAYVVRMHLKPEPRNYQDARGLVINDYQNMVEQNWIASLKTKYPVRLNEKEWNNLLREKKF